MATRATSEPLKLALSVIPSLPRPILARIVARAIERLDEIDGDPDAEQTGDEGEPDFTKPPQGYGPGCIISDSDFGAEDMGEDCREGDVCEDLRPIADPQAYKEHRARLRRERTYVARRYDWSRYGRGIVEDRQLLNEPKSPSRRQLLRRKRGIPKRPRA